MLWYLIRIKRFIKYFTVQNIFQVLIIMVQWDINQVEKSLNQF